MGELHAWNAKAWVKREATNAGAWMFRPVNSEAGKAQRNDRVQYKSEAGERSDGAQRRGAADG